eukprot:1625330-Amphidinium_carterae.1
MGVQKGGCYSFIRHYCCSRDTLHYLLRRFCCLRIEGHICKHGLQCVLKVHVLLNNFCAIEHRGACCIALLGHNAGFLAYCTLSWQVGDFGLARFMEEDVTLGMSVEVPLLFPNATVRRASHKRRE